MLIARVVVSLVLAALFLTTGGVKLLGHRSSAANRESLGVPANLWRLIGVFEWLGAVGLIVGIWFPLAGLAASAGLVVLLIGAIVVRVRASGDQRLLITADCLVMAVAIVSIVLYASEMRSA